MSEELLAAVRESIQEIAETMLFVDIAPGKAGTEKCTLGADISAVIGYSSSLKGSLRLAGPMPSALKLAGALLGEERSSMDKEMEDAFAEMANMIAGGVQTRLEATVGQIRMSPPVVISGRNHQVSSDRSFSCISHQFELDGDPFFTEIYYAKLAPADEAKPAPKDEHHDKYGFSLTVPMPHATGFEQEDADEASGEDEESGDVADAGALLETLREAFTPHIQEWAREMTREKVVEMLPAIAERLVREEIERIKREGL